MRLKMKKKREESIKPKAGSLKGLIKLINFEQVWQRKKENTQITSGTKQGISPQTQKIFKTVLRNFYKVQFYAHKLNDLDEIYQFLKNYNLPKLTHDKIHNLDIPITIKESEFVVKHFLGKKSKHR